MRIYIPEQLRGAAVGLLALLRNTVASSALVFLVFRMNRSLAETNPIKT